MKEFIEGFIDGALPISVLVVLVVFSMSLILSFAYIGGLIMGGFGFVFSGLFGFILWCGLYNGTKRWLKTIPKDTDNKILRQLKVWII